MSATYNVGCSAVFDGDPQAVIEYLWDTRNLQRHVPHVRKLEHLTLPDAERQLFRMHLAPPGAQPAEIVTSRAREHCRIRYVQLQPHPLLRSHQGDWLVTARPGGSGSIVYLNHTLQLDEQRVEQAKPEGATGIAWALMLVSQGAYRSLDALATAFDAARASLTSRRAAD